MAHVQVPPLAITRRSATLVRLAQAATVLSICLIAVHVSTNLLIPIASGDLAFEDRSQLIHIWLGLAAYPGLRLTSASQWILGGLAVLPYVLIAVGAACMWSFLREATRGELPSKRAGQLLARFAVLLALAAVVLVAAMPIGWLVGSSSLWGVGGPLPLRITVEHVLLILFSGALFAVASMFSDAAVASEEARGIV